MYIPTPAPEQLMFPQWTARRTNPAVRHRFVLPKKLKSRKKDLLREASNGLSKRTAHSTHSVLERYTPSVPVRHFMFVQNL